MAGYVLFEDDHLALVRVDGDDVYLERSTHDLPPTLFRIAPGEPARPVAQLGAGRPRGALQAVEGDALLCLEADGTLAALSMRDGRRHALRRLDPAPAAVAITPAHVVWCSSDTRAMDGVRGPRLTGEIWRWRRGGEHVERLGEHPSFRPDLAIAPAPAPGRAPDVYVGAGPRLGVVDGGGGGLRWLAHEPQGVDHLACGAGALFYAAAGRVKQRALPLGEPRVVWRETIVQALAPHGRALVVARNAVIDRRVELEPSAIIAVDLDTGAGAVLALDVGRPTALAANAHGVFSIEEPWRAEDGRSRLVFYPWGEPPVAVRPGAPPIDPALWTYPPLIQWWRPDGGVGYFQLDAAGSWTFADGGAGAPATGAIDPAARAALLAAVQAWREDEEPTSTGWVDLSQQRGWLIAWGAHAWHRAAGDRESDAARAVARLLELLAPACPLLAAAAREG